MLRELMWREWVLNRPALAPMLLVFALVQIVAVQFIIDAPRLPLFLGCMWACVLIMVPFAREHQFRAVAWSCTLPAARADLLRARYLSSWILVVVLLLSASVATVLARGRESLATRPFDLDAALVAAAAVAVFIALMFPPVARYGPKGAAFLLIGLNVLLPLVFVVSKVTGTQDSVEGVVLGAFASLMGRVAGVKASMPALFFYPAVVALFALVNGISYRVAAALFRNREF